MENFYKLWGSNTQRTVEFPTPLITTAACRVSPSRTVDWTVTCFLWQGTRDVGRENTSPHHFGPLQVTELPDGAIKDMLILLFVPEPFLSIALNLVGKLIAQR